ncbi:MAG: hypothetical protein ACQEQE_05480 [Bacillota bacterium]
MWLLKLFKKDNCDLEKLFNKEIHLQINNNLQINYKVNKKFSVLFDLVISDLREKNFNYKMKKMLINIKSRSRTLETYQNFLIRNIISFIYKQSYSIDLISSWINCNKYPNSKKTKKIIKEIKKECITYNENNKIKFKNNKNIEKNIYKKIICYKNEPLNELEYNYNYYKLKNHFLFNILLIISQNKSETKNLLTEINYFKAQQILDKQSNDYSKLFLNINEKNCEYYYIN